MELQDLTPVSEIAREAGKAILEVYDGHIEVEMKDDRSPLTAADRASNAVIEAGLEDRFPGMPVLSEEGSQIPFEARKDWDLFWCVDPLDGTKEFIKRNGEFTVNIALVQGCRPIAGVIYVPVPDILYAAAEHQGAWRVLAGTAPEKIAVRRPPEEGIVVVKSRSHPSPEVEDYIRRYKVADSLVVGSSLKICSVAEGAADLYPRFGPTMEWDTAAGHAILNAAGGVLTAPDGSDILYNKRDLANGPFVAAGEKSLLSAHR